MSGILTWLGLESRVEVIFDALDAPDDVSRSVAQDAANIRDLEAGLAVSKMHICAIQERNRITKASEDSYAALCDTSSQPGSVPEGDYNQYGFSSDFDPNNCYGID